MYMYVFESSWILLYFISFWMLANCIMINLVIAFVLDIYGNVSNEVEAGTVYTADFDADRISSGIYMVRLSSGTTFEIERLQIQK